MNIINLLIVCVGLFLFSIFTSCSTKNSDVYQLVLERDSILLVLKEQQNEVNDLTAYMATIAIGLDSIAQQEKILLSNKDTDGKRLSRKKIIENLNHFKELLQRQHEKIQSLEDSLRLGGKSENLRYIISYLNKKIEEKEQTIKILRTQLANSNNENLKIKNEVSILKEDISSLEVKYDNQEKALKVQDQLLNECYIKISDKETLQNEGIISGGLLTKKKINYSNVNINNFTKIDIRKFVEIRLSTKKPKILTPVPINSYKILDNNDGTTTLQIIDINLFWSISNYLIIQI